MIAPSSFSLGRDSRCSTGRATLALAAGKLPGQAVKHRLKFDPAGLGAASMGGGGILGGASHRSNLPTRSPQTEPRPQQGGKASACGPRLYVAQGSEGRLDKAEHGPDLAPRSLSMLADRMVVYRLD